MAELTGELIDPPESGSGEKQDRRKNKAAKDEKATREVLIRSMVISGFCNQEIVAALQKAFGLKQRQAYYLLEQSRKTITVELTSTTKAEMRALAVARCEDIYKKSKDPRVKLRAIQEIARLNGLYLDNTEGDTAADKAARAERIQKKLREMSPDELQALHSANGKLIEAIRED